MPNIIIKPGAIDRCIIAGVIIATFRPIIAIIAIMIVTPFRSARPTEQAPHTMPPAPDLVNCAKHW